MIQTFHSAVVARKNAGGGTSYLLAQTFEGAGTPAGWTIGGTGTVDPDSTTTPLQGVQSLAISASAEAAFAYADFTGQASVDVYFLFRINSLPGAERIVAQITDGTNDLVDLEIYPTGFGYLTIRGGNGTFANTATGVPENTVVHVWLHYEHTGIANQATGRVAWSTDGVKPTTGNQFAEFTTGAGSTNATRIQIGPDNNATIAFIADVVLVNPTIGSNPPVP